MSKIINLKPELAPGLARSMAEQYLARNWKLCLFDYGTKGPQGQHSLKWNEPDHAVKAPDQLPENIENMGLLHSWSDTAAIDLDDVVKARAWFAERDVDLDALLNAQDAVRIVSGRENRDKLIYRLPTGIWGAGKSTQQQTKQVHDPATREMIVEFRNTSMTGNSAQDVLPPSIHPDTGTVYKWAGGGIGEDGLPKELPVLPEELAVIWNLLIEQDRRPVLAVPNDYNASFEEAESALYAIDPDCPRATWIECGMALSISSIPDVKAYTLWNQWSSGGKKYKPREMAAQWRSFKDTHPNPIRINTLFFHAKDYGWSRPKPDIATLFAPVAGTPDGGRGERYLKGPAEVIAELTPKSPPMPIHLLPPSLANYAIEVAQTVGGDVMVSALAGIAAASAAIDARCTVEIWPGYKLPPVLDIATVGSPADKKTPISKEMFKILDVLEKETIAKHKVALHHWEGLQAQHAAAKKAYLDACGSPEFKMDGNIVTPEVPDLPPMPVQLKLTVNDATSAVLIKMAEYRPYGLLYRTDELSGLFAKLTTPGSGEDRTIWTIGHDTGPYFNARVSTGERNLEFLALGFYGNIQPKILRKFAPLLETDGLLQRSIIGVIDGTRNRLGSPMPEWMSCRDEYEQAIRHAHAVGVRHYKTDHVGAKLLQDQEEIWQNLNQRLVSQGYDTNVTGAVGKLISNTGRVLLNFHMMTAPESTTVPVETVRNAIEFCNGFVMKSIHAVAQLASVEPLEKWLVGHILDHANYESKTLSEITRSAKNNKGDGESKSQFDARVLAAMSALEEIGPIPWVIRQPSSRSDSKSWLINPNLAMVFEQERAQMKADREAFIGHISTSKQPMDNSNEGES
jgi:hypothetical protein